MDSLAAAPGTGPATNPLPVIRKAKAAARFEDLAQGRTLVMGVLNVTPDSFSDGGNHSTADSAIAHGLRMFYGGADIIDVGGESTRPGADPVTPEEEQRRVLPVVAAMVKAGALVSIDTVNASTAAAALDAGALIVNDVSGQRVTAEMIELVSARKVPYILTHSRGDSQTMDSLAVYTDVVGEVVAELEELRGRFRAAGHADERLILDPGLGFAKAGAQNWELLRGLDRLTGLGHRVLVGASRKRFLGELLTTAGKAAAPIERDAATVAVTALSAGRGAWAVRVHDVGPNLDAVKVAARFSA
ncbi:MULTISPECIES: dihydropteroate synthase [Arthrobacter]|uniref:Dihydropteroate synthase n=2 Tax=Arthrobacter TaxID=1663 RepID=A0ABU9KKY1_9MICC|nr:dihydropteroate synthase [Arthrobacter sp. YJM1]MDP5226992.1 dihydropteroate synthase [Arthrobacter sp. YJM1]